MRQIIAILGFIFVQHACAETFSELSYKLKASVVKVHVATKNGGHGVGTGVVVGKDLVATNCHVLANASGVQITKFGDSFAPVALKADWKHDLCVLRFQYLDLPPAQLGDSENLKYELPIFAIGFPGGPMKPQTTTGKIKALYKLDDSQIVRTDASFVMGASGSPVFNMDGQLIAINTFKSPGRGAYFYNVPVKWIKALIALPESAETVSMSSTELPFWDAFEENRPFFMRVVMPYQNAQWKDLQEVAQKWITQEPNNAEALFYAGIAEENLGDLAKANQYFQQVLILQPSHPSTLMQLGLMANRLGNTAEVEKNRVALKDIDIALEEEYTAALLMN